jgi:hypothetical protein
MRRHARVKSGPITFALGTLTGAMAGFVLGALLGKYALHLISFLIGAVDRRGSADDERLKFELLLQ